MGAAFCALRALGRLACVPEDAMRRTLTRLGGAFGAAALLAGCHAAGPQIIVRSSDSGRSRTFEFDGAKGELTAWNSTARLLQMSVNAGALVVFGSSSHNVGAGCRAGFLTMPTQNVPLGSGPNQRPKARGVLIEVQLCPRTDVPDGWRAWHADLDVQNNGLLPGTVPTGLDFACAWEQQDRLLVSSRSSRVVIKVPSTAAVVRRYPELFALAVMTGIVPPASDGKYEVE
jgi:hypothetical protein